MNSRSLLTLIFINLVLLLLSSCQTIPACPPASGTPQYLNQSTTPQPTNTSSVTSPTPVEIEINHRFVSVDRIIEGPLCNDHLEGTVYVGCGVQVFEWDEKPLFFKDCDLTVEPGAIVYVADHNNAPYYNGCSCHTGEEPIHESLSFNQ